MAGWRIRLGDKVWHEADVTLGHLLMVEELTGSKWPTNPLESATHLVSFLAALLADDDPSSLNASLQAVQSLKPSEARRMVEADDDEEAATAAEG